MVVDDPEAAAALVAAGSLVVLIAPPASAHPAWPDGPGRMALLVGQPDDPSARAAALNMDRELFSPAGR